MLVVKNRGVMRRYRYGGSGILDSVMQKIFSGGVKSAINKGVNSVVAQKVVNAVVNGATSTAKKTANAALNGATAASQRAGERAVNEALNTYIIPYVKKKLVGGKRAAASEIAEPTSAKREININSLIDGSGIVLD